MKKLTLLAVMMGISSILTAQTNEADELDALMTSITNRLDESRLQMVDNTYRQSMIIQNGGIDVPPNVNHEFVDLGIRDGSKRILWATVNLNAENEWDFGDFYAFGDIETYYYGTWPYLSSWKEGKETGYNWSNYKWCEGKRSTLTKYCLFAADGTVDNKKVLDPEDDAAHTAWGGGWQIPAESHFKALINNCYWVWTTSYKGHNVKGYIVFKAKDESDKGKYPVMLSTGLDVPTPTASYSVDEDVNIFLPASGFLQEKTHYCKYVDCSYWTVNVSDYDYTGCCARRLYCNEERVSINSWDYYTGNPIRPICIHEQKQ